jgi:7-cyano-7-deazaguanine reductase
MANKRNSRIKKNTKKKPQKKVDPIKPDDEVKRMMETAFINLDEAEEATKRDTEYHTKETKYPEDAEHEEWRGTGFWGGYHKQGGDEVIAAQQEMDKVREKEKEERREALKAAKEEQEDISKHLGQSSDYPRSYDASALVREKRQNNRAHLDVLETDNFFLGADLWNAYEISCLTVNGMPMTAVAQILYPCTNKYIVESKSLKLYLNSFNMTRLGKTTEAALKIMQDTVQTDLSELLETTVTVNLQPAVNPFTLEYERKSGWNPSNVFETGDRVFAPDKFKTLENIVDRDKLAFNWFEENPDLLKGGNPGGASLYHSSLLKSNCKITHQPDWGDVFIYINSDDGVSPESLLKYIVSFRHENHFHEEICETIYKRLHDKFHPHALGVSCFYTRRGGIDINPVRVSSEDIMGRTHRENSVLDSDYHVKLFRQ